MDNKQIKEKLKSITDICVDSSKGYETAADQMEDKGMETLFDRLAQQRKLFVEELNSLAIKDLGFELDTSGTIAGHFHRKWIDITSKLTDKSDEDVINDALQGEDIALKVYNEVIQSEDVPAYINEKLKAQRSLIEGAKKQLHTLKEMEPEAH
ncbi:MAG: PA2169 family four-helix-bundle protein [Fulvivirga sp.]|nr:PA2169 family four-helix-bundle protein [Fulvivirga sp.]